jgi:hypothetical protein
MRQKLGRSWSVLGSVALTLACSSGPATAPDMGAPPDAGPVVDANAPPPASGLPPAFTGTMTATMPAMLSCVGHQTAPMPGSAVSFTLNLLSFGEKGDHAPNTHVCFCAGNAFSTEALAASWSGNCGTGCTAVTTDMTGHTPTVMGMANGWYAYRVFATVPPGPTAGTTFLDSIQINEPAPSAGGGSVDANAVSSLIANTVSQAELIPRTPMTTTFAGRVRDCHGDNVQNATVRAYHADGTQILEPANAPTSDPHYRFFSGDGATPDAGATYTAIDGLYVVLNVPPQVHGEVVRLEAWSYPSAPAAAVAACAGYATMAQCNADTANSCSWQANAMACSTVGTPVRIGCEAAQAFPDGVSIVNIGPTRSDYPAGHPCHM